MKRTPLKRKTPLRAKGKPKQRARLRQRAKNRPQATRAEVLHLKAVKALPCVICGRSGPSDAHHVICDRYGSRKASHFETVPLCRCHHQDGHEAIHNGKRTWREKHGPDWAYLPAVMLEIYGVESPTDEEIETHWKKRGMNP